MESSSHSQESTPSNIPIFLVCFCACIPLLLAILSDVGSLPWQLRSIVVGISLGIDRSGSAPISQIFAPWAQSIPLASIENRALFGLAIPSALAVALLVHRTWSYTKSGWVAHGFVVATAITASILLFQVRAEAALAIVAFEVLFRSLQQTTHSSLYGLFSFVFVAMWAFPIAAPALVVCSFFLISQLRQQHGFNQFKLHLLGILLFIIPLLLVYLLRARRSDVSIGDFFREGVFTREYGSMGTPELFRISLLFVGFSILFFVQKHVQKKSFLRIEKACFYAVSMTSIVSLIYRSHDGLILSIVLCIPHATGLFVPIQSWFNKKIRYRMQQALQDENVSIQSNKNFLFISIAAIVPMVILGLSARALEVEIATRRIQNNVSAAHAILPLLTTGVLPAHSTLLFEEEKDLINSFYERNILALRADTRVLPVGPILQSGQGRIAQRTMQALPETQGFIRALLSRAILEEHDISSVTQRTPLVANVRVDPFQKIAKHILPWGHATQITFERIDRNERRTQQKNIELRLNFVIQTFAQSVHFEFLRKPLRIAALREAKLLTMAGDYEAATTALVRARSLGAFVDHEIIKLSSKPVLLTDILKMEER